MSWCRRTESRQELLSGVFDIEGKPVQVEQLPTTQSAFIAVSPYLP
jgi:hypothetical protein